MDHTILLIDDDPSDLEVARTELARLGYEVVPTTRWTEAIAILQDTPPDLVLLDLNLLTGTGGRATRVYPGA